MTRATAIGAPRRRWRRVGIVATVAVVLSMALSGCFPAAPAPSTSTPRPEKVSAALTPFYDQHVGWTTCGKFQCAKVKAPLDWSDPSGGSIELALIRHYATGKRLGSLLVNPGGPGASGVDFVRDSLDYAVDKNLIEHYDIVGFDPRGVGASTAVKCYGPSQMDDYIFGITPGTRGSDAWIQANTTTEAAFAAACKQNTGALLGQVGTVSAARDLDLMRAVLGDAKLNYLGYSYGTLLGATYAGLYPKHVGRMVLDGALDPASTLADVNIGQSKGFESEFRSYLTDCLKRKGCPFSGTVDDAMNTVANLLKSLDASPIRNSDGRELGADTMVTAIITPLYSPSEWTYLDSLFNDVMAGSARVAFILADSYYDRNSNGTYADNSTEAFSAINCLDYPSNADPTAMRAQAVKLEKAAPVFGPYMAYGDIGCSVWPYKPTRTPAPIHAAGAAPILVVGTTGDPATPYQWAVNLSRELDSGHLVTYHGNGHTAYNKSNSCVNDTVDNFFVSGTVPKTDPEC
ncbi:alpha/beta hydrolase [Humibacter ginsenosidimutans]|uniref:Alpha/beta hydrolase n=1 Tax=Humibacter ginsenosidimutans TaxID=2599293 RepID=A0A5B8M815_9MICO|nr:alpha/beta hydrolase [Humibacter ginsenosidimutans]QDZ16361.1 alpha/beta hydrolase [Humibacter ginsenosidimutans]